MSEHELSPRELEARRGDLAKKLQTLQKEITLHPKINQITLAGFKNEYGRILKQLKKK